MSYNLLTKSRHKISNTVIATIDMIVALPDVFSMKQVKIYKYVSAIISQVHDMFIGGLYINSSVPYFI